MEQNGFVRKLKEISAYEAEVIKNTDPGMHNALRAYKIAEWISQNDVQGTGLQLTDKLTKTAAQILAYVETTGHNGGHRLYGVDRSVFLRDAVQKANETGLLASYNLMKKHAETLAKLNAENLRARSEDIKPALEYGWVMTKSDLQKRVNETQYPSNLKFGTKTVDEEKMILQSEEKQQGWNKMVHSNNRIYEPTERQKPETFIYSLWRNGDELYVPKKDAIDEKGNYKPWVLELGVKVDPSITIDAVIREDITVVGSPNFPRDNRGKIKELQLYGKIDLEKKITEMRK
jgi:hypothetical protein